MAVLVDYEGGGGGANFSDSKSHGPLINLALWNRSSLNTCSVKIYLQ
jgi:hypothetical protein